MQTARIRVAIVEDNEEIRTNLSQRISGSSFLQLAGKCADAEAALAELPRCNPDVVLMDINLPRMDGVECVRQLKKTMPRTQFVMLTVYEDSDRLFASLMAGASGYLLKRVSPAKLLEGIREASEGGAPMTPQIARRVVAHFQQPAPKPAAGAELTQRENAVLMQLAKGLRYKEVADTLGIGLGTVYTHIRNIYEKLHVHSRTEAVMKFLDQGGQLRG